MRSSIPLSKHPIRFWKLKPVWLIVRFVSFSGSLIYFLPLPQSFTILVMTVHSNWSAIWNPCSSSLSFITFNSRVAFSNRVVASLSIRLITSWAGRLLIQLDRFSNTVGLWLWKTRKSGCYTLCETEDNRAINPTTVWALVTLSSLTNQSIL